MDGASQWAVGLYLAPAGTATPGDAAWQLVGVSTNRAGNFRGLFTAYSPLKLPNGWAVGTTYATMVRGWELTDGSYGASDWQGTSVIGSITPAADAGPFPFVFGTGAGQIGGFDIIAVPEPSTIALGVLGLGAVALLRRRRK